MSDHEFVNRSLQNALQLIRDEATKPLHVEIQRLRGLLRELLDSHTAMMPSFEQGVAAQDAWAERRDAARVAAYDALRGADQPSDALLLRKARDFVGKSRCSMGHSVDQVWDRGKAGTCLYCKAQVELYEALARAADPNGRCSQP